jgi:hypothetical protein
VKVVTRHVWEEFKEKVGLIDYQNRVKCFINLGSKNRAKLRRLKRAAWASLLLVTGIEECK